MIYFAAKVQGWFVPKVSYRTEFSTKEGTYGLQKGGEIRILNILAGSVKTIRPQLSGNLEAIFEVKQDFQKYIRKDSFALVKKKFGLAGDTYVEIIPGDPKELILNEGAYLKSKKDTEIMETVKTVIEDLRTAFVPALEQMSEVLEKLPSLTTQVKSTFIEAEDVLKELKNTSLPVFNEMLQDVNKNKRDEFFRKLRDIGFLLEQTLFEAEKALQGIQSHWLLRKYVNKEKKHDNGTTATTILPLEVEFGEKR